MTASTVDAPVSSGKYQTNSQFRHLQFTASPPAR